jgi:hypothetical protein
MSLVINQLIIIIKIHVINVINLRGIRWAVHATCVRKTRNAYRILVENRKERCRFEVSCILERDTIKMDVTKAG